MSWYMSKLKKNLKWKHNSRRWPLDSDIFLLKQMWIVMTINHYKTCFILFHTKNKPVPRDLLNIDIDGIFIQRVTYTKYLGVVIDEKLNWHEHVNYVCSSLIKFFGIFSKIKHFMNKNTARNIYFALIYSRINYGIEVYGKCAASYMSKFKPCKTNLWKCYYNFITGRLRMIYMLC